MADHLDLGQRFYAHELLKRLAGQRVEFVREVDRLPFVVVPVGAGGTLMAPFIDDESRLVAAVMLDGPPPSLDAFDGEIHWVEGINLFEFEKDVRVCRP
jgi:hypothetical protein